MEEMINAIFKELIEKYPAKDVGEMLSKHIIDAHQGSEIAGLTTQGITKLCRQGKVAAFKMGGKTGAWLILKDSLISYKEKKNTKIGSN